MYDLLWRSCSAAVIEVRTARHSLLLVDGVALVVISARIKANIQMKPFFGHFTEAGSGRADASGQRERRGELSWRRKSMRN